MPIYTLHTTSDSPVPYFHTSVLILRLDSRALYIGLLLHLLSCNTLRTPCTPTSSPCVSACDQTHAPVPQPYYG